MTSPAEPTEARSFTSHFSLRGMAAVPLFFSLPAVGFAALAVARDPGVWWRVLLAAGAVGSVWLYSYVGARLAHWDLPAGVVCYPKVGPCGMGVQDGPLRARKDDP